MPGHGRFSGASGLSSTRQIIDEGRLRCLVIVGPAILAILVSGHVYSFLAALPAQWLRSHGGLPDFVAEESLTSPDGVPRDVQRLLLREVSKRGGEAALFSLPSGLERASEPLLFVMLNSRDVDDFIDKEQRLQRFFHGEHRVRIIERGDDLIELAHEAQQSTPDREESLYVLALHLQMFELIGCQGISACLPESADPVRPIFSEGVPANVIPEGGHLRWRITWLGFSPRREPMSGLDEVLLESAAPMDLQGGADMTTRLVRVLATDLAHRWMVAGAALQLHTSTRTLQRELSAEGTTFVKVLDIVRVEAAGRLLADSDRTITEVGYVCGFSDSSHFSRRFKLHKGISPKAWRDRERP